MIFESIDALLQELKGGEKYRIDRAGAAHGYAETAVHVLSEEFDLHRLDFLSFRVHEAVSLIYALGRVDGIYSC